MGFPPGPQRSGAAKAAAPSRVAGLLALGRVVRAGQGREALLRRERLAQRENARHHGANRFSDRRLAATIQSGKNMLSTDFADFRGFLKNSRAGTIPRSSHQTVSIRRKRMLTGKSAEISGIGG